MKKLCCIGLILLCCISLLGCKKSLPELSPNEMDIIEIGENIKVVCKHFLDGGMTPEEVAKRMDVPMKFVNACMR